MRYACRYDYSGYGASSGKPSESNTYANVEAVYECLQTQYGVRQADVILYGQSVGGGSTLHLASKLPRLKGVVLHSGTLSGLPVLLPCTEYDVVNWLHGNGLWNMAREPSEPLWIKGGGHCNLELHPDYIRHLRRYILEMENVTTAIRVKTIRQNLRLNSRSSRARSSTSSNCCRFRLWRPKYRDAPTLAVYAALTVSQALAAALTIFGYDFAVLVYIMGRPEIRKSNEDGKMGV